MILEQVLTRDLGCAAYVVGCDHVGQAIVVDPPLHVQPVLDVCRQHGLELVGVIETHTHADHVAGHGVLATAHGVWIATHPLGRPEYDSRAIVDGDRIVLGHVALDVLHTPGHRPEHCCIAIADLERGDEPWILLTGDSLFVGDVARPDLAVAGAEGAEGLFRSLHRRLAGLGDGVEVFPGHVAGSLCGRAMSSRTSTTLGFERQHNAMLAEMSQDRFVRLANANLAPKPPTMARVVELNRGPLIEREPVARTLERVPDDAQLVDVRPAADVAGRAPRRRDRHPCRHHGLREPRRVRARPRARGHDPRGVGSRRAPTRSGSSRPSDSTAWRWSRAGCPRARRSNGST